MDDDHSSRRASHSRSGSHLLKNTSLTSSPGAGGRGRSLPRQQTDLSSSASSAGPQRAIHPSPSATAATDEPFQTSDNPNHDTHAEDDDDFFLDDDDDVVGEESKSSLPNTPADGSSRNISSPSLRSSSSSSSEGRRRSSVFGHRRFSSLGVVVDEDGQQWLLRWTGMWVFRASYRPGWM